MPFGLRPPPGDVLPDDAGASLSTVYNLMLQLDPEQRAKYGKAKVAEALSIERQALKQLRGVEVGAGEAKPRQRASKITKFGLK